MFSKILGIIAIIIHVWPFNLCYTYKDMEWEKTTYHTALKNKTEKMKHNR